MSSIPDTIDRTLGELLSQGGAWERGDNLALLQLPDDRFGDLARVVTAGLRSYSLLTLPRQQRWGALMMIAGAHALRRAREEPRKYATIGRQLGFQGLEDELKGTRLDALQAGLETFLDLELIRSRGGRRFLETMISNSGIDIAILETCAERVSSRWSWRAVQEASVEDVAAFLDAQAPGQELRPGLRVTLTSEEGRLAVSTLLQGLSTFRSAALERGLVGPTLEATRHATREAGLDPAGFLGMQPSDDLLRHLFGVASARDEGGIEPVWRWSTSESFRGLQLQLPRILRSDLPPEVGEAWLTAVDPQGHPLGTPLRYCRDGGVFRLVNGSPSLPLRRTGSRPPVLLFLRYDLAGSSVELAYRRCDLPRHPVTAFDLSGPTVARCQPGARLVLVLSPGWRALNPPWHTVTCGGLEAWRVEVPAAATSVELQGPDGDSMKWTLGGGSALQVRFRQAPIDGVRLASSPVFTSWPDVLVEDAGKTAQVQLSGPCIPPDEPWSARVRFGRVRLKVPSAPGRYDLQVSSGSRKASRSFVFLPSAAFQVSYPINAEEAGYVALAGVTGFEAVLTPTGAQVGGPAHTVRFTGPGCGARVVGLALPALALAGQWSAAVHPPGAALLHDGDERLPLPWDFGACDAASWLEVTGAPGTQVELRFAVRSLHLLLSSEGRRRLRFPELAEGLGLEAIVGGTIEAHWDGGQRRSFSFRNQRLDGPNFEVSGPTCWIESRRELASPVEAEHLPVWQPWLDYERRPARRTEDREHFRYEFDLPASPGQYLVGLVEHGRPATGLRLAVVPGTAPDLSDPLSTLLWEKQAPRSSVRRALREGPAVRLERIAASVGRYGPAFFHVAEPLVEVAGGRILRQLLEHPGDPEDGPLGRLLRRCGLDLTVITYLDLHDLAPLLAGDAERTLPIVVALAHRRIGLTLAALRSWPWVLGAPGCAPLIAPWAQTYATREVALTEKDLDLIRTPEEELPEALADDLPVSPRVIGLLQARRSQAALRQDGPFKRTVDQTALSPDGPSDIDFGRLTAADVTRLPTILARIDEAAYVRARGVHAYRKGRAAIETCRHACVLSSFVPALMDFWMNHFAMHENGQGLR